MKMLGAPDTNRTCDPLLRRKVLYPLSYGGPEAKIRPGCGAGTTTRLGRGRIIRRQHAAAWWLPPEGQVEALRVAYDCSRVFDIRYR